MAFGIVAGVLEARISGLGQVIDVAMLDGAAALTTQLHAFWTSGTWTENRGVNILDSGAPFYDVYETADGKWMAVGAIEPTFYSALLEGLGLNEQDLPEQNDQTRWPEMRERFASIFHRRTREEWEAVFEGTDGCATPVLSPWEAPTHPHNRARKTFQEVDGIMQPSPVPRFWAYSQRNQGVVGSTR